MCLAAARTRWACPSLGTGTGHDAHVSTGRLKEWACPLVSPDPLGMSIVRRGDLSLPDPEDMSNTRREHRA